MKTINNKLIQTSQDGKRDTVYHIPVSFKSHKDIKILIKEDKELENFLKNKLKEGDLIESQIGYRFQLNKKLI